MFRKMQNQYTLLYFHGLVKVKVKVEGVKAAFAVVPTDKICGRSLSSKIPVDMNSILVT
jgi:hypothetical protein